MRYSHAKNKYHNYNTFHFFENSYSQEGNNNFDELDLPEIRKNKNYFLKIFALLIVIVLIGLSLPPVLSYTLKTPYPLVVITENSMQPTLAKNDLILVKGVINKNEINTNDLIVYNNGHENKSLIIKRVIGENDGNFEIKGDDFGSLTQKITYHQVVGKLVGNDKPVKVKWIGAIIMNHGL